MKLLLALLSLVLIGAAVDETTPNADGLKAVEAHWTQAFTHGDAAYLQNLLTDDYVSVNAKGIPRDKATIIKLALSFAAHPPAMSQPPSGLSCAVTGSTGIVTSDSGGQRSVDVFYYADGRWHAWYSQHTTIANS